MQFYLPPHPSVFEKRGLRPMTVQVPGLQALIRVSKHTAELRFSSGAMVLRQRGKA